MCIVDCAIHLVFAIFASCATQPTHHYLIGHIYTNDWVRDSVRMSHFVIINGFNSIKRIISTKELFQINELIQKSLVTEGKTLVTKGKTLVIEWKTLATKGNTLATKGKTLATKDKPLGKTNHSFAKRG